MEHWIVGGALALGLGVLISLVNYRLSLAMMKKNPNMAAMMSIPRQLLNVAYLLAVYFLSPMTPWDRTPLLVGAVLGLTVSLFFFTHALLKGINPTAPPDSGAPTENHGGDDNG